MLLRDIAAILLLITAALYAAHNSWLPTPHPTLAPTPLPTLAPTRRRATVLVVAEPWNEVDALDEPCVPQSSTSRGHAAVLKLTLLALETADVADVMYNPTAACARQVDAVLVLNSWTKPVACAPHGAFHARRFVVGPNVVPPARARVDAVVVPSNWTRDEFERLMAGDAHRPRIHVSPLGVPAADWRPSAPEPRTRILVYEKIRPAAGVLDRVLVEWPSARRVVYGLYTLPEYRDALAEATAVVAFSHTESQGLYMFEAWAAGVPTFVYAGAYADDADVPFNHSYDGRRWRSHPAPYLVAPDCGAIWRTIDQLTAEINAATPRRPSTCALAPADAARPLVEALGI